MPPPLASQPELFPDLQRYLDAFYVLTRSRHITEMGIGGIPLSEIKAYCDLYGVHDVELFVRLVYAMDDEYMTVKAKNGHQPQNSH